MDISINALSIEPTGNRNNKKVLLRERKRHTAHRVASTPYVVLTGYPPVLAWGGYRVYLGTPQPGYPQQGTSHQGTLLPGYPPRLDLAGYPPLPGWTWQGTPPAAPWHSGKCCKALWDMGTPPVDRQIDRWMEGQTRVKTLPSRRTTYAGGNKRQFMIDSFQLSSKEPKTK